MYFTLEIHHIGCPKPNFHVLTHVKNISVSIPGSFMVMLIEFVLFCGREHASKKRFCSAPGWLFTQPRGRYLSWKILYVNKHVLFHN